jgi:L-alanine-DL-glutamate epimerase-like enolase superfamily enzyme
VSSAFITARRPADVAREVERRRRSGITRFVLRRVDDGAMLDQERLGAARYAAGLQAEVELDGHSSPAPESLEGAGAPTSHVAAVR